MIAHPAPFAGVSAETNHETPAWLFLGFSFAAGLLTPFAINLVGLLPVGELVLGAALAYLCLWIVQNHQLPGTLLASPLLWTLLGCQALAFVGYAVADIYRGSTPHDIVRGWARMVFLAMDLLAVAFVLGAAGRDRMMATFVAFEWGYVWGGVLKALFGEVIFDDYWKFGFAIPVTIAALMLAPRLGFWATQLVCLAVGGVHMMLDFRSMGALCLLLPFAMVLQRMRRSQQLIALPVCLLLALGSVGGFYYSSRVGTAEAEARSGRSDIERGAMLQAAWDGFQRSPLIGNGSWFSKSDVMEEFYALRYARSKEAGIGSFTAEEEDGMVMVIHSQLLVGLAEGGIFGGCFFLVYGGLLIWAMGHLTFQRLWDRWSAIQLFTLVFSMWSLCMSPFSGLHRILIAITAGLILIFWTERGDHRRTEEPALG